MKKRFTLSVITATLLGGLTTSALFADNVAMKDTVAQKEAKVVANPSIVKNQTSAKAKVEETQSKDEFKAKEDAQKFAMQARIDRMQRLQRVFQKEASMHQDMSKNTSKSIMEAIHLTFQAAQDIKNAKHDDASKKLEQASMNFDAALKKNPKLDLVPIAQEIQIKTFIGSSKIIKEAVLTARELLKEYKTQEARQMLLPLRDEMDFIVQYLPMKTYPIVTKHAAELLKQKKDKEALIVLAKGFGTIVAIKNVVPIPLMLASDMTIEASKVNKAEKEKAIKLLEAAKEQLKRAYLLGYTSKHSEAYKAIEKQIDAIEDEIKGKNIVEKMYEDLASKFKALFKETRKDHN